ncbi:Uncharacterized protein FWK35_00025434, partial [Aphis craccivora]
MNINNSKCYENLTFLNYNHIKKSIWSKTAAAGYDEMYSEFLKFSGPKTRAWLTSFYKVDTCQNFSRELSKKHTNGIKGLLRRIIKAEKTKRSLLYQKLKNTPNFRLKSRKPPWSTANKLVLSNFEGTKEWRENCTSTDVKKKLPKGMDLPRDVWSVLNRIRTGHGRCHSMMSKWDLKASPAWYCSYNNQTVHHIVEECLKRRFNRGIEGIHTANNEALE